jgi:hypothetical protein
MIALKQAVIAAVLILFVAATKDAIMRPVLHDVVGVVVTNTTPE